MIFTFHRYTGEPLFEIEERPVPTDGMPEDDVSPTQPFPVKPPPLVKHGIGPDDAWGLTPYDRNKCRELIESMRYGPILYAADHGIHADDAERGRRHELGRWRL